MGRAITEPDVIGKIPDHLGIPSEAPGRTPRVLLPKPSFWARPTSSTPTTLIRPAPSGYRVGLRN